MNLDEAQVFLNDGSEREEFRDHAFGDMEVAWKKNGETIAEGYFGGGRSSVVIGDDVFLESDAFILLRCGRQGAIERNDETGPDDFVIGRVMPGLTREGVKDELTKHNVFESNKD